MAKLAGRRTEDITSKRPHFTLGGCKDIHFLVPDAPEGTVAMNRLLSLSLTLLVGGWITSAASAQYGYPMHPAPAAYYPPINGGMIGYAGPVMPVTAMQQQPMAMVPVMIVPVPVIRPAAPMFGPLETMPPSGPLNPHALEAVLGQPAVPAVASSPRPPVPQEQTKPAVAPPVQQAGAVSATPAATRIADAPNTGVTSTGNPWYRKAWDWVRGM